MKFTQYFLASRNRPDRFIIKMEWIQLAITHPIRETIQADKRIRRWANIPEMNNKILHVVLLDDAETVHNAFFDRSFRE